MGDTFKCGGMVVLMILATIGPIYVAKTIEAAREQARQVQCKNELVVGNRVIFLNAPADATKPENVKLPATGRDTR